MNELTKTEQNVPAVTDNDFAGVKAEQNIGKNDIAIPKVLIMQGQSPRVLEGEAQFGELLDSLNWKNMGDIPRGDKKAKPLICLPFHWEKYWNIRRQMQDKWVFDSMVKMDSLNENLDQYEEWQGNDGVMRRRVYQHLFYVLVKGSTIPFAVAFRGSSKSAGDNIVTQMYVINKSLKVDKAYKCSPMAKMIKITPKKVTNEKGTFIQLEACVHNDATFEEACEALKWHKQVMAGAAKVDLSKDEEESDSLKNGVDFKSRMNDGKYFKPGNGQF